ncbi:type-F conjugative transfer system secretin TraK [Methylorubrum sp. GM97]|uniref:type-F conjugative transfer system secretin TraK n=1 Tax=Methylorubrum sp. GM97 TaxID=2938232 RepID=UPI0021879D4D|nr:type-F conjugative transfer system secretin TraK [Methylorubrum sp. GM97]BDL38610.1 hypothetical protein MSPGM_12000 [Methylorubrum sp. GM97]
MPKVLSFTLLLASLSLTSVTGASAAQIGATVYGDGNSVRSTGYGHGPFSGFVVDGDGNDFDLFAGPCPGGRPSQTVITGSGRRGVRVAPCLID